MVSTVSAILHRYHYCLRRNDESAQIEFHGALWLQQFLPYSTVVIPAQAGIQEKVPNFFTSNQIFV
ncbi:MAG: hypothetical protein OXC48_07300 [Endozoicomonadaceae bacterium]|nr:hypothetical protein [Endozoicomonadaceae bacterium]